MSVSLVALGLFHGRRSPEEQLNDWGETGPVFQVTYVHVTYGCSPQLGLDGPDGEGEIPYVSDLLHYNGMYYGDWSVFPVDLLSTDPSLAARLTHFEQDKAAVPPTSTD